MNLKQRVWLPPDGDSRLVRFQEEVARLTGRIEAGGPPPHLSCAPPDRVPDGPLRLASWQREQGVPVLRTTDDRGCPGALHFVFLSDRPWTDFEMGRLPPPPAWVWTRGRIAWLDLDVSDEGTVVLWSWTEFSGWRSDHSRE